MSRTRHSIWYGRWIGIILSVVICHLVFSLSACSSIDCPVQTTVKTSYAIMDADGVSTKLTDTLYVWTQQANGKDTLILNRAINVSSFSLPISYHHPEDILVFYMNNEQQQSSRDTVWLKKEDIPHFESVDCAAHFFHKLTNVRSTHVRIDTVMISNPDVNYDTEKTHLHIRFKTAL